MSGSRKTKLTKGQLIRKTEQHVAQVEADASRIAFLGDVMVTIYEVVAEAYFGKRLPTALLHQAAELILAHKGGASDINADLANLVADFKASESEVSNG